MVALNRECIEKITRVCPVDLYLSVNGGAARGWWPWRMEPVHQATASAVQRSDTYILDSSIQHEEIGNQETLDTAHELGADYVVLADVWQDFDATVDRLLDGLNLHADHPCEATPILPLQPPHGECYQELGGQHHVFAIGGVKDATAHEKIQACEDVREVAGPAPHLHGLGFGFSDSVAKHLARQPDLLDSCDSSTAGQQALNAQYETGTEVSTLYSLNAGLRMLRTARKLGPLTDWPDADPEELRTEGQAGLTTFQ